MYDRQIQRQNPLSGGATTGSLLGASAIAAQQAQFDKVQAMTATESERTFKDRPELAVALTDLESTVSLVERLHRDLLDRLHPLLRPEMTNECSSTASPKPVRCVISDEIDALETRLRGEAGLLMNLMQRLAV